MTKRVGIIALLHESNTFLDQLTTMKHFTSNLLCRGAAVLEAFHNSQHEVGGFIDVLQMTSDLQAVGIFAARRILTERSRATAGIHSCRRWPMSYPKLDLWTGFSSLLTARRLPWTARMPTAIG